MPLTRRDFVRTMFVASQTAVVGRLLSSPLHAGDTPPGALNFAVIGDWGRRGRPDQTQVAGQMALACQNASARFVISVGDNFYNDGVAGLQDPQWNQSFENVYNAKPLQVPWYVILGNHDYRGNSDAQLQYTTINPRWIMPARYYSKVYPIDATTKVECFYIDTSPMIREYAHDHHMPSVQTQDVPAQLAWLETALAASTAQWKLVFGHHPLYSAGSGHGNQKDMIEFLLPILNKYKVPAYFSGHDHDLQHLKSNNIDFFISGGGSEHRPVFFSSHAEFGKGVSGFALASLRSHEMQVQFIDNNGKMLYSANVQRAA